MFGMPGTTLSDITPDRSTNQHAAVLENFCAAILQGAPLIAPARDGLDALSLANAMLLSTWESAAVSLPLDSARYASALAERVAGSALRKPSDVQANVDMSASYR